MESQVEVGTFWCLNVNFKINQKLKLIHVLFATLKCTLFKKNVKQSDSLKVLSSEN
jgi:hypothetical protein